MTFEEWMLHRGLSQSSAASYDSAIRGVLSEWGQSTGLVHGPLTSLVSRAAFDPVDRAIRALPIYIERNAVGHNRYHSALLKYSEFLADRHPADLEADIDQILDSREITETERRNLIKSRIGQGAFRQKLVAQWGACSVTGFKDVRLLIASHIKPWSESTNSERLDPFNGLLLIPNLDRAFDAGLISFGSDGGVMISRHLLEPEKLGIHPKMRVSLSSAHQAYMAYHRKEVFGDT